MRTEEEIKQYRKHARETVRDLLPLLNKVIERIPEKAGMFSSMINYLSGATDALGWASEDDNVKFKLKDMAETCRKLAEESETPRGIS